MADGRWHHVAATRAEAGDLRLFVDGRLVAEGAGAPGDMSYRDGRGTDYPGSDPYLVLGAEKHDAGSDFPSFNGWLDELRVSNTVRYTADFDVPAAAFEPDAQTVGLFHMDEGGGDQLGDSSAGATRRGGALRRPVRRADVGHRRARRHCARDHRGPAGHDRLADHHRRRRRAPTPSRRPRRRARRHHAEPHERAGDDGSRTADDHPE